jgi:hypothetical protein
LGDGHEEDKILGQEVLVSGVVEELLTEQFAGRSGVGVEIEQELLVLELGLGLGLFERALEERVVLGEGAGGEKKKRAEKSGFFHANLLSGIISAPRYVVNKWIRGTRHPFTLFRGHGILSQIRDRIASL